MAGLRVEQLNDDGVTAARCATSVGSSLHLRLTGEFDLACIGRVEAALERVSDEHTKQVVFDLSGVSFLDSAGLRRQLLMAGLTGTTQTERRR